MRERRKIIGVQVRERVVISVLVVGLFLCCLYALHDMQTALGIGLYFTLKLGLENRLVFDILVDLLCMGCLVLLLWLPCLFLGRKGVTSYGRLFIGYLAIVPTVNLTEILNLFNSRVVPVWNPEQTEGVEQWFFYQSEFLQVWLPLLLLLYWLRSNLQKEEVLPLDKWHKVVWLIQGVLLILALCIPATMNFVEFWVGYLGLLLAFDCWESMICKSKDFAKWSVLLFSLLLMRGIYHMMALVSKM